ncbi:MAG: hypothetical protein COA99_12335 [Moraxellaceae bacterium]|nr:MAG: hypothetical protein COA99_12335 [Moraxellaceae bacterium]
MFDVLESGLVLCLALSVMFSVGLDLDFRKLILTMEFGLPLAKGLLVNLLLIPILVIGCLSFFALESAPSIAILLCALCAGGSTGLLFSLHAKGDMIFSLSLFMVLNLLSLILVPIYLVFMVDFYLPDDRVSEPLTIFGAAVMSIFWFQILPLAVGMSVRRYSFGMAIKIYPYSKKIANISLVCLFVGFAITKWQSLVAMPLLSIVLLMAIVVGTVLVSAVFGPLGVAVGRSMVFVTVVRNLTLALLVSDRVFDDAEITLVILTYGLFMYIACALLLLITKRLKV